MQPPETKFCLRSFVELWTLPTKHIKNTVNLDFYPDICNKVIVMLRYVGFVEMTILNWNPQFHKFPVTIFDTMLKDCITANVLRLVGSVHDCTYTFPTF